jgi:hypothetical protein
MGSKYLFCVIGLKKRCHCSEYSRLIYEEPIEFAELVLTGNLQPYLREYQQSYHEQERELRKQLEKRYPAETVREIARAFMMRNS